MEINIHRKCCRGMFHADCPESPHGGIVQEHALMDDSSKTLVECLHCHQKGIVLKGTPFHTNVCIEEIPEDINELISQCKPLSKTLTDYLDNLSQLASEAGVEIDLDEALKTSDD